MHGLGARCCLAGASSRSSPSGFSFAYEPGRVMLEHLKKNFERIQQLRAEYERMAKEKGKVPCDAGTDEKHDEKMRVLIQAQEFCTQQIEAAHAERATKI